MSITITVPYTLQLRDHLRESTPAERDEARMISWEDKRLQAHNSDWGYPDSVEITFRDDAAAVAWKLTHMDDLLQPDPEPEYLFQRNSFSISVVAETSPGRAPPPPVFKTLRFK